MNLEVFDRTLNDRRGGLMLKKIEAGRSDQSTPLCIDLDGCLVRTDLLVECMSAFLRQNVLNIFLVIGWLLRGRSVLKAKLAERIEVEAATLPYESELVDWIRQEKASGRRVELITASDQKVAERVADHLNLFDSVHGSCEDNNLKGSAKAEFLLSRFGVGKFDYAGDARADLDVWDYARKAVLVNPALGVVNSAKNRNIEFSLIGRAGPNGWAYVKAMRPHQWAKNLLIFVPIIFAQRWTDVAAWQNLILTFLAFSLCASAVYILNDLVDAPADRKHHKKCRRPIAAGQVDVVVILSLIPLLLIISSVLASAVSLSILCVIAVYFSITTAYSLVLKSKMLVDVFVLTVLYMMRIFAGTVAIEKPLSIWLFGFSMFAFFSLALVKRFIELQNGKSTLASDEKLTGRGYGGEDLETVQIFGIASCFSAVVVLGLYLQSTLATNYYAHPQILWLLCPMVLYLLLRIWMLARRGLVNEDPVLFALRDRRSQLVVAMGGFIFLGATL